MRFEPLYGLPVEEPGDVEGSSVVAGAGDLLAERIAAELQRIQTGVDTFAALLDAIPAKVLAGDVAMLNESFVSVSSSFYNSNYWRAKESVIFSEAFADQPSVVLIHNLGDFPGTIIEVTAMNISTSGFTAAMAVSALPATQYTSRWIAVERTQ